MINLETISSKVLRERAAANESVLSSLNDGLSMWLSLLDLYDKCEFLTRTVTSEILENTKDEIFGELHVALVLAYHSNYRSAAIITRSCLELAVYILYFIDHPADCLLWNRNSYDMSFTQTASKIFDVDYIACITQEEQNIETVNIRRRQLLADYKMLSECVHGKPGFMSSSSKEKSAVQFSDVFSSSIKSLLGLAVCRLDPQLSLLHQIPALERYAHV